jgi:hypothetical protein
VQAKEGSLENAQKREDPSEELVRRRLLLTSLDENIDELTERRILFGVGGRSDGLNRSDDVEALGLGRVGLEDGDRGGDGGDHGRRDGLPGLGLHVRDSVVE